MTGTRSVLVVDDDDQVRGALRTLFERDGWVVMDAVSGQHALRVLFERRPDVLVLDVGMAGLDGWETLRRVRELSDLPVLMLTGSSGELDKVRALRAGADDYVTKPFGRQELIARTEALVRRSALGSTTTRVEHYDDGLVAMNFATRLVTVAGEEVSLSPLEYRILAAFVRHPNHVLSASQLLELAWESGVGTRDQVKIYVGYVRRKLGEAGDCIETARGFGYRYRPRVMTEVRPFR
jgi:DNA-binding response OmpR family regulator